MATQNSNPNYSHNSQGPNRGNWRRGQSAGGWRGQGQGSWRGQRGGSWRGQRGRGGYNNRFNRGRGVWQNRGQSSQSQTPRRNPTPHQVTHAPSPYRGWQLYFPRDVYSASSPVVSRVKMFEKYFTKWKSVFPVNEIGQLGKFTVDFKQLSEDPIISEGMSGLATDLKQSPETIISCMGLAMHQVASSASEHREDEDDIFASLCSPNLTPPNTHKGPILPKIHCQITNYLPITVLANLKASYYGKFISIKGTVVRVGNVKPLCTRMAFDCATCGTLQCVDLPDGKYTLPSSCTGDNCQARTFKPLRSHALTETIDWQTIRIQEIIVDNRESGRIPRTVDCELTNHLVDSAVPGDVVTLSGIVKVMSADEGSRNRQKDKCMFLLYLLANSLTNTKGSRGGRGRWDEGLGEKGDASHEFSLKELYAIEEIHSQTALFRLIVGSMCPNICGHEMVKAGLTLGLFGGSQKYANDSEHIPVRGDPHILVVGDPGLGKSQMLKSVANIAPRSVYICGNTTTTSGLTVTLCKEGKGGGDYALEAGALVLADQGCCCIDEFDKMSSQHQALLEAMEQQCISIAKAGIVCSLPARTSVFAAANPTGGHYNKAKTVSENLKMGSALLSRFDLVFILIDKPDDQLDLLLSEHVMSLHTNKKRPAGNVPSAANSMTTKEAEAKRMLEAERPLSERLKVPPGQVLDLIPPQLLRKYISYARKYVQPKVTAEAASVLQEFYLSLRQQLHTQDTTPITTRQLESLIRLSEARARLELREEVTKEDAMEVVEIMKFSMMDVLTDNFGFVHFQRSQHGSGMSNHSKAKKFIAVLQKVSQQTCNALFTVQEMRQLATESHLQVPDFENFVSSLNNQGYLIKKGPRVYQVHIAV